MPEPSGPAVELGGVFVPTTTPFDPVTGDVDVVGLRSNIRSWFETAVKGIVIGGSTGEAVLLAEDERRLLWETARDVTPQNRLLIAGAGAESTRGTVHLCRMAAVAGADAVLVQPPAFYKGAMNPEALARHYRRVADESPLPVIVYQVPLRLSTLDFPTGLVAELSHHDNVIGIKDSRGALDLVGELVEACQPGFRVLVGSGANLYGALELGAVGGILAVANLAPAASAGILTAYRAGRTSEAGRLQERVGPIHNAIVAGLGVPGVKAALDLLGLRGGNPRSPLTALGPGGIDTVTTALKRGGLLEAQPA